MLSTSADETALRGALAGYAYKIGKIKDVERFVERAISYIKQQIEEEDTPDFISDNLTVDFLKRQVKINGRDVCLTFTEFNLLRELVSSAGEPVSKFTLIERVWGINSYTDEVDLRVHVNHLRKKIEEDTSGPRRVITVPKIGYKFQPPT